MGFFRNLLSDAADELKKKAEEAVNDLKQKAETATGNLKLKAEEPSQRHTLNVSSSQDRPYRVNEDDEEDVPSIELGEQADGILTIREGFKKLDSEYFEGYKKLRKIIFPSSIEQLEEDLLDFDTLEEIAFTDGIKLKKIPSNLISGRSKIEKFVIPQGVQEVDDYFLGDTTSIKEVYVPASVKQLGSINVENVNSIDVYLFTSGISLDDIEQDVHTFYVLPSDYVNYAEQLKECDSDARIKEMPEEKRDFYSHNSPAPEDVVVLPKAKVTPTVEPASTTVNQNELIEEDPNLEPATKSSQSENDGSDDTMFSQRLEALIKSAFQDGVLTQKEKEILIRRAEKEGEDPDEFEMLLDERISRLGITVIQEEVANPIKVNPSVKVSKTNDSPFSDRLKNLIDNALEDGQLTEQERNAIIRRAQAENEDIDEVDIYIQSLQQKRLKELKDEAQQKAEKERVASMKAREAREKAEAEDEKERSTILRKCPACGATLPPLTSVCPECGIIIDAFNIDKEIITLIQAAQRADFKIIYGAIVGAFRFIDKSSFDNDPIMTKAYRKESCNLVNQYKIFSNYVELMNQLRILYSDNPKVKNFLDMQRNVEYNKIIARGKECIEISKRRHEEGSKSFSLDAKTSAYGAINLLKQYNDMPNYARDIKELEELYEEIKDYR